MILDELRTLLRTMPFQPFSIFTGDGREVHVHHHDFAWVLPSGGQAFVEDTAGRVHIINISQITRLSYAAKPEPAAAA